MKVILIKDVARLGRKSEVKEVPAGHAQNFLLPRKLAIPATPENLKRWEAEGKRLSTDKEESKKIFKDAVARLSTEQVIYTTDANNQGHLFKGVSAKDIAGQIQSLGINLTPEDIELPHPLKALGTHEVTLVRGEDKGICTLVIVKK